MGLSSQSIENILEVLFQQLDQPYYRSQFRIKDPDPAHFPFESFLSSLNDSAAAGNLAFVRQEFTLQELNLILPNLDFPLLAFHHEEGETTPIIIYREGKKLFVFKANPSGLEPVQESSQDGLIRKLAGYPELSGVKIHDQEKTIFCLSPVTTESFAGGEASESGSTVEILSPIKRFLKFIRSERKNILYIYTYAVIIGIINLSLPLGIQAIIGRISGGILFDGVIVLITFVILGIILSGGLQIMQIYLVEMLQRRIFTKAAFEFAFRLPRIKTEALLSVYPPELMNRFFDVITLQKGFSKILLDLTTSFLQILFGLILLSLYHPSFIFFGIVLLAVLLILFRITGPKALKTSIKESSHKYRMVAWLEELARNMETFKLAGYSNFPIDHTDRFATNYLGARKKHFGLMLNQFIYIALFKLLVTAGTLILGCILVVNREITLGQFVASEIVIITVISAAEKLILSIETVYDVLTAVEKIGQVSDFPLEPVQGIKQQTRPQEQGHSISVKNLSYSFPESRQPVVENLSFDIKPGEKVCITGLNGSGKHTLTRILSGLLTRYSGVVAINGISLRNLSLADFHESISVNLPTDDLFEGTIEENIRIGRKSIHTAEILRALENTGVIDFVNQLPEGIFTPILPGGKGLPGSVIRKLLLARSLVRKPALFIFHDVFSVTDKLEKEKLFSKVLAAHPNTTMLAVTADPGIMKACNRIILLQDGRIAFEGSPDKLDISRFPNP